MKLLDKFTVTGPNGEIIAYLNERLVISNNVSDENLEVLKLSHQLRYMLFEAAKSESVKNSPAKLRLLAKMFDELEFEQQELWGFERDQNYHCFFDFPGCTCPKLDNFDQLGTPYKIYARDCPIHGSNKT